MFTTPSFDHIKSTTEKAVVFVEWFAEVLHGRNWVKKLLLLDAILFLVFNSLGLPKLLEPYITQPLPGWYTWAWGVVIVCVFGVALIIAYRTKPRPQAPGVDFKKRSAIKGLRPFGIEDAELFARLQREQDLHDCLEAVTDRDFRFGILCGESGCGKSSFLQAGLSARLEQREPAVHCLYVKFSDLAPMDSLRQALVEQFGLAKDRVADADFLTLLESAVQVRPGNLVLLFDQFEQFFVHFRLKEDRKPFVQSLAAWYQSGRPTMVKILVCLRGDFLDRLMELQNAMTYSLGVQNSFRLEKFSPEQAKEILCTIAESEGIDFDQSFVKAMAEHELASREDGLISPVDIQILAWMIAGQKTSAERAFNQTAYQKLGGVEGLLERFLSRAFALTTRS
jgi:hypothetical protein